MTKWAREKQRGSCYYFSSGEVLHFYLQPEKEMSFYVFLKSGISVTKTLIILYIFFLSLIPRTELKSLGMSGKHPTTELCL